jgi:hypothetical protein
MPLGNGDIDRIVVRGIETLIDENISFFIVYEY